LRRGQPDVDAFPGLGQQLVAVAEVVDVVPGGTPASVSTAR
jgi:hypothetical protein